MTNELNYGWWQDEAILAEQLAKHGSINRAALANGVTRSTLQRAVLRANITPGTPPAAEEKVKEPRSPKADMLMRRVRDLERDQTALVELRQSIENAARNVVVPVAPTPPIYAREQGPRWQKPVDIILHVSDIQYGEDVHGEDVPGGRYSPEIFRDERLPRYVEAVSAVIDAVSDQHPIGTVIFAHGGDELEGHDVFAGQAFHLAMDAGAQVATFAPVWAQAISTLAYRAKMRGAQAVAAFNVVVAELRLPRDGDDAPHPGRHARRRGLRLLRREGPPRGVLHGRWTCLSAVARRPGHGRWDHRHRRRQRRQERHGRAHPDRPQPPLPLRRSLPPGCHAARRR
jgi:hypothetical protein